MGFPLPTFSLRFASQRGLVGQHTGIQAVATGYSTWRAGPCVPQVIHRTCNICYFRLQVTHVSLDIWPGDGDPTAGRARYRKITCEFSRYYLKNGSPELDRPHQAGDSRIAELLRPHARWRTVAAGIRKALRQEECHAAFHGPVPADMVRFQRYTGKTRRGPHPTLRYRNVGGMCGHIPPESHKTEHHGRGRVIVIGPEASELLRPYLLPTSRPIACPPQDSARKRREAQHEVRRTPSETG